MMKALDLENKIMKPTPYADVNEILNRILTGAQAILEANFVGMYLDGSLASGDFNYETSDIDFVVATAVPVSPAQFTQLAAMHGRIGQSDSRWGIEVEGAYIPLPALRRYDPADATHPYIDRGGSHLRREKLAVDWVIHQHVLGRHGVPLAGPPAQTIVDPVSAAELRQAVRDLLDVWWVPMIHNSAKLQHDGYRTYAILTMCRMLYTGQTGDVVSKPAAARWALATQGARWHRPVSAALHWQGGNLAATVAEAQALIQFTRGALDDERPSTGPRKDNHDHDRTGS